MKMNVIRKGLFGLAVLLALVAVNLDLFHFQYDLAFPSEFHSETEVSGDYPLTEFILLRPGPYSLKFDGEIIRGKDKPLSSAFCGFFVEDIDGNSLFSSVFENEDLSTAYDFHLQSGGKVRVGVRYAPEAGDLRINTFRLSSDHILTRESLLRHGTLSAVCLLLAVYLGFRCFAPERIERRFSNCHEAEKTFLLVLFVSAFSCLAFGDPSVMMDGDDLPFHLARIEGIAADFRAGIFPPKIYLDWMNNYGVGAGFYYPDLFLYIPALMRLLGFSLFTAYRTFNLLCSITAGLTMYFCVVRMSNGSRKAGRLAAVFYILAPYRLICMIYRCALGEVQAFVFFPLIALGLYEVFVGDRSRWKLLTFGFLGLLCSHLVSLAIAGVLTALTLLLLFPYWRGKRTVFSDLLKAAALTLLVGAFFLLPLAEQSAKNSLRINEIIYYESTSYSWKNMARFKDVFRLFDSWEFLDDHAKPYIGWNFLLTVPLWAWLKIKREKDMKLISAFFFSGLFLLFAATDAFPWRFFSWFLLKIQFSWRLLFPAAFFLAVSLSLLLERAHIKLLDVGMVVVSAIITLPMQSAAYHVHSLPLPYLDPANQPLDGYEYTPIGAEWEYCDLYRDQVLTDHSETEIPFQKRTGLTYEFSFQNAPDDQTERYAVPLLAYASYESELTDKNGEKHPLMPFQNENGLITLAVDGVSEGTIRVAYRPTWIQRLGEFLSVLSLIGWCCAKRLRKVRIITKAHESVV